MTDDEKKALAMLRRLEKIWPKSLWIFSGGSCGSACVLRTKPDGSIATDKNLSFDPAYIVADTSLPIEGGDF